MDFSSQPQAASLPAAPAVPVSSSTAAPASSNSYVLSWPQPTDGGHAPLQPNQFSSATTFIFCCCYCRFCRQHCLPLPHSPSHLSQVNKHQLSILANADEAVSPRSRSFRLCWWFKLLSLSTCSYCWWYLSSGKSVLSSVETTGPTHSKCLVSSLSVEVLHLVVDCQTSSSVWRPLEQAPASISNSRIMQLHGSL